MKLIQRFAFIVAFLPWIAMPVLGATQAPTDSLFFTPAETAQIEALASHNTRNNAAYSDIHLGAVMYYGPGQWTLWLKGERWTPETEKPNLRIVEVNPETVRLSVILAPESAPQEIVLHAHQTYQIATGKIIEGLSE